MVSVRGRCRCRESGSDVILPPACVTEVVCWLVSQWGKNSYSKQLMLNQIQSALSIAASRQMIYDRCVLRMEWAAAIAVTILTNLTEVNVYSILSGHSV